MQAHGLAGDLWGGLASTLVALPASLAFGVAIYAPLGPGHAAEGALAGLLGAAALGLVAPLLGGTERLISAPCAPAAAVLGALALELGSAPAPRASRRSAIVLLLALTALLSGALQLLYGLAGGGTLIKYIPYPVVTGYLSGVGVVILLKQLRALFGFPAELSNAAGADAARHLEPAGARRRARDHRRHAARAAADPEGAGRDPRSRRRRRLLLRAGLLVDRRLLTLAGNPLVIGPLGGEGGGSLAALRRALRRVSAGSPPATCRSCSCRRSRSPSCSRSTRSRPASWSTRSPRTRHASNRELVGQGLANLASAASAACPARAPRVRRSSISRAGPRRAAPA